MITELATINPFKHMEQVFKIRKSNRMRSRINRNFEALTSAEVLVMELLRKGNCHKEIGDKIHRSPKTISTHARNIQRKYNVRKETAAVDIYLHRKHGILDF